MAAEGSTAGDGAAAVALARSPSGVVAAASAAGVAATEAEARELLEKQMLSQSFSPAVEEAMKEVRHCDWVLDR